MPASGELTPSPVVAKVTKASDLRSAEAQRFDVPIENGTVKSHRVRLGVSSKYEPDVTPSRADHAEEREPTRHGLQ
jgi:hypothetical protein